MSGIANVFEAQFRAQVLDGGGNVLADEPVMATCGTGCWGPFKASVPYDRGQGAVRHAAGVSTHPPRTARPINVTEYRVWLTP